MGKVKVRGSDAHKFPFATLGLKKTGEERRCQRALSLRGFQHPSVLSWGFKLPHSGCLRLVASLQKPEKGKGGWIGSSCDLCESLLVSDAVIE